MSEYSDIDELGEISDIDQDDDDEDGEDDREEDEEVGHNEILVRSSESPSNSPEDDNDNNGKLTDIIKAQQMIIDSLRQELASIKFQMTIPIPTSGHRKCATKSEESTSAVVSSFEDDDDDLDSLSSEDSADAEGYDCLPDRGAPLTNPLFVDVIVQKVMEHLPLKCLLLARFVCHKWNMMACSQIASKCALLQLEVHQPWKPSKGIKVSTFIDVMRNGLMLFSSFPFSKYSISSFNALEELDRFFFHFGRTVKHLDLNFSEEFEDSQEMIILLTRKLPHLESLRIGCCQMFKKTGLLSNNNSTDWLKMNGGCSSLRNLKTFCIGNIINIIPSKQWLEAFFHMTPNLEKLVLHVNFKENGNTFIRIVLEALMNSVDVLKNIKNLMISCLTESHLRTLIKLAECGLRLKHFRFQDLCLHLTEINGGTLETFLSLQADYLETLEIEQSSNFPRIRHFQLPVMKTLKTLSVVSSQRISFGSLSYCAQGTLPKLEKLVLRGFDVFNCGNIFPENLQKRGPSFNGHSLRTLSLPSKLSIPHFPRMLSKIFPGVTDLEVRGVTNELLKEIWESWPKLEKFKLVVSHFDDNIDAGMTGIPEEVCRELRSENQLDCRRLKEYKNSPAITDLKWLRSLEMECRAMWIPCQLMTDITGYFALVHLTKLQKLKVTEIGVPEKFDLSNECITEIINTLRIDDATFKIMDDHGRWQLELGRIDLLRNTYESEPQLEDHNKDKVYKID